MPRDERDVVGSRPGLELADIVRKFATEVPSLSYGAQRVFRDIEQCRTAALGGHVEQCNGCDHRAISYNSCRNRHCPKCQSLARVRWQEARQRDLLPVPYFHVVFTIPDVLHSVFRGNARACYTLLFSAASETLKEVANNPKNLGARIGLTAVLHTWTQKLMYHPHVHCLVPGGGLSVDGKRWVPSKRGFLLPVGVLSTVFRGKLLQKLERALRRGELSESADGMSALSLKMAARKRWVVYSKPPFAGPEQVLSYLGRYTHRIALSNSRLLSLDGRIVRIQWRDRADANKVKTLALDAVSFLQRFLLHLLPYGFVRIRHFGFLANAVRRKSISLCRELLDDSNGPRAQNSEAPEKWNELLLRVTGIDISRCPSCGMGRLFTIQQLPRPKNRWLVSTRANAP